MKQIVKDKDGNVIISRDYNMTFAILSIMQQNIRSTEKDYNSYKYEYDEKGNKIKTSLDGLEIFTYDKNNRLIYNKFLNVEKWYEYDNKGRLIRFKDSLGNEIKYDENYREIYFKNYKGLEEFYEYED